MKKLNLCLATLMMFTLVFTSCTKDDPEVVNSEKATLSFGATVNDLMNKSAAKQALADLPACSADAPAFVRIVLMQGDTAVVGTEAEPYRVDLVEGQLFTEDDPALQLDPGSYSLDHFSVYNEAGDLIWIAPRSGSELGEFVDSTLPLAIELGAGVKKYVDVEVLCFDDREVNEYGYLFFELETVEAYELCFFANYCDDDGRHFTANYSLDVWLGTDNTGTPLYADMTPETGLDDNGDYFARPVCLALPVNENADEDYIYYEATLMDWDENYGTATPIVLSGTMSRSDIEANFGPDSTVEYEHLYFNCGEDIDEPEPACLPAVAEGCERVVLLETVTTEGLPAGENPSYPLILDGEEIGTITYTLQQRETQTDLLTAIVLFDEGWEATHARFTLPNVQEDDVCVNNINDDGFDLVYEAPDLSYPLQARVAMNVCPE